MHRGPNATGLPGRDTSTFATPRAILEEALAARAFPAAVVEVGSRRGVHWRDALGALTYDPGALGAQPDTLFDLASLTKVLATATVAMRLIDAGALELDAAVAALLPAWRGTDRESVTVRDLLAHSSGLTAYLPFFRDHAGRAEFERAICTLPLEYAPRSQALYSDLGFILLGFIIKDAGGTSLDRQFSALNLSLGGEPLFFRPSRGWCDRVAPTEVDPWRGRLLVGDVHDENAWALGGVAGHAGLFGTAAAVGAFARSLLAASAGDAAVVSPDILRTFVTRTGVPNSSRALAWDTMLSTSSCGRRMSPAAVGHTGFTGTSLWIDPVKDVYIVLLTNRVHPTRENQAILGIRPRFHDAVMEALG